MHECGQRELSGYDRMRKLAKIRANPPFSKSQVTFLFNSLMEIIENERELTSISWAAWRFS